MTPGDFQEMTGDLWAEHAAGAVVAITTSAAVSKRGRALLLRGCGRQARDRFPDLPDRLGSLILRYGSHVFELGNQLVNFPVEIDPFRVPELRLIEQSCRELVLLADEKCWLKIVVPRPGCGGGGLSWKRVKPILGRHFDERFVVIHHEGAIDAKSKNR